MIDPIVDMLNRIRNSQAVFKETVSIPFSNLKYEIAKILEKRGYIEKIEKKGRKEKKFIELTLKYEQNLSELNDKKESRQKKEPVILGLKRISKQGQRIYKNYKGIKLVRGGYGMAIVSTPKGLMTDRDAKKSKLGGEILCEIW
ncbi:MAG: 30S ribosomal protein S8 [Candidatus Nealsonbacteria bacterium]